MIPISTGARRPYLSESGPITNWPSAPPMRVAVMVNCTAALPAPRSRPTSGRDGRYISVVKAPNATISPSSATNLTVHILLRGCGLGIGRRPTGAAGGVEDDDGAAGLAEVAARDTDEMPKVTKVLEEERAGAREREETNL